MNGIILFQSKYGATKKYAEWLVQETGYDCIETGSATVSAVEKYEIIILMGGIYASGIAGLPFLKKNIDKLQDKKFAVFCVGASPFEEDAFRQVYEHNFKNELQGLTCFYGRGAWNENEMTIKDWTLCKLIQKAVAKKDPATYEPWEKALMCAVGQNCDWTERSYLSPLLAWIGNK